MLQESGSEQSQEEDEEAVLEEAWAALEARRHEWLAAPAAHGDFTTNIIDGCWNLAHRGHDDQRIIAQAKKGTAQGWCAAYNLNKAASFSVRRYGQAGATALSMEWCTRLQHFYNIWATQDNPNLVYTAADLASYREGAEWASFLEGLPLAGALRERAEAIRHLAPGP